VKEVSNDAVDAALHKQGTYALQKVLESPCRDSEFVQLGKSLMERGLELVSGEPGIYVMSKLVEQLVSCCLTPTLKKSVCVVSCLLHPVNAVINAKADKSFCQ